MRVALFLNLIDPKWLSLSMERYGFELKKSLEKLDQEDLELVSFQPQIPKPLTLLPTSLRYQLSRYYYYPFFAQRHEGQVNHIIDHSFGQLSQFLNFDKTVITCHDLIPLKILKDGTMVEKDPKARELFKKSVSYLKQVRFVIADSMATKRDLQEILEVDEAKIRVIYLGKNEGVKEVVEKSETRKKLNLLGGKPIILHVGHNLEYKNIDGILKALNILKDSVSFSFVKVGPEFSSSQKELIRQFEIQDKIIETGFLSEKDLTALYQTADCLVYPSLFEGFGLPVLEAMNVGLPVVVSRGTSLEEITEEKGVIVDPQSPEQIALGIKRILDLETQELKKLKQELIVQANKFNWKKTAEETLQVYRETNG